MSRFLVIWLTLNVFLAAPVQSDELQRTIRTAQRKVAKIFGAGGLRQLEAYQSGILVSPEGHVLTANSYVLDTDDLVVVLDDGRKWQAEFLGSDPVAELALLKLKTEGESLPYFNLQTDATQTRPIPGERILALSNLYGIATGDEPVSVLQGVITAIAPLRARRGAKQTSFREEVFILDAYANNPGAAGGALVDWQGRLLGLLGKELRSEVTGTWLNYALPVTSLVQPLENMLAGRVNAEFEMLDSPEESHSAESLGFALIPDVLPRTPPYVDSVRSDSPAQVAGMRPDDLVVFIEGNPVDSHQAVVAQLTRRELAEPVTVSVLRDGNLREFTLQAAAPVVDQPSSSAPPATDEEKP